jgi:hypothetical protein
MDAYTREPLRVGQLADSGGPFTNGSLLTLQPRSLEPRGPYKNVTGKAGIKAIETPFELQPGKGPITVMAGLLYPAAGLTSGSTSIVVTGDVFYKNQPVPYQSVVGKLTVLPRPDGRMHGDSQSHRGH